MRTPRAEGPVRVHDTVLQGAEDAPQSSSVAVCTVLRLQSGSRGTRRTERMSHVSTYFTRSPFAAPSASREWGRQGFMRGTAKRWVQHVCRNTGQSSNTYKQTKERQRKENDATRDLFCCTVLFYNYYPPQRHGTGLKHRGRKKGRVSKTELTLTRFPVQI